MWAQLVPWFAASQSQSQVVCQAALLFEIFRDEFISKLIQAMAEFGSLKL